MIRWHDHGKRTRKREQPTGQPAFWYKRLHDLTQTVLLTTKFKAFKCNIILCRSLYKLLSKIVYALITSLHRVTRPVHPNVLHLTTLTRLDGLKESRRSSLRRLLNHSCLSSLTISLIHWACLVLRIRMNWQRNFERGDEYSPNWETLHFLK